MVFRSKNQVFNAQCPLIRKTWFIILKNLVFWIIGHCTLKNLFVFDRKTKVFQRAMSYHSKNLVYHFENFDFWVIGHWVCHRSNFWIWTMQFLPCHFFTTSPGKLFLKTNDFWKGVANSWKTVSVSDDVRHDDINLPPVSTYRKQWFLVCWKHRSRPEITEPTPSLSRHGAKFGVFGFFLRSK